MANEMPNENNKHWGIGRKKKRSNEANDCIVYISGGDAIQLANQFLDYSIARMVELGLVEMKLCEVHLFTPDQVQVCLINCNSPGPCQISPAHH